MGLQIHSEFCAQASIEHGEPIVGTAASKTSVWLGVEVCGAWPHDAWQAQAVPASLQASLRRWAGSIAGFRPQALHRPARGASGPPAVFLALTDPDRDAMFELNVASLDALSEVDLVTIVAELRAGNDVVELKPLTRPMIWVCMHGKRDRCCSKLGAPVYEAAVAHGGVEAWQASHLGGHRFAATLLCLPRGVCYGRVQPNEVSALIDAHSRGAIFDLERLRGRSCWSGAGQAAEHFVREATGDLEDTTLTITGSRELGDEVEVDVEMASGRATVTVQRRGLGVKSRPSCAKDEAEVMGWFLVDLQRS